MSNKADKIFTKNKNIKRIILTIFFVIGLLLICTCIYIAFKSAFLVAMFCISLLVLYFLKEKFFGLIMTFLSAVILLLKVFYIHSITFKVMPDNDYILICVSAILGIIIIAVCTILERIDFYKIISTKKSL